jgi:acyl-CoA synthetase (AMP-forming)/AMP-acid ligase II
MTGADPRYCSVDDRTMGGMLRWKAQQDPAGLALVCGQARWTWRMLNERTNRVAAALRSLGLGVGDRVGLFLTNHADYLAWYLALAKTGVVGVPVNPALTAPELAYIVADSGCRLLLVDEGRHPSAAGMPAALPAGTPAPAQLLLGSSEYRELLELADPGEPPGSIDPAAAFFMCYTSGTTGAPKGCVQSHRGFVDHHWRCHDGFGFGPDDVMLIPGPLFHEAPALFSLAQLFFGGTVVVLETFTPELAVAALRAERCTTVGFAVPVMLQRICQHLAAAGDRDDWTGLRSVVVAGAPLLAETMHAVLDTFPATALIEFYGATELGVATFVDHRECPQRGRTAGRPFPGMATLILDETGEQLPTGEVGEIFVSPVMMDGYHRRPEATAEATRRFGEASWLSLGDLGYLDADGYLQVVDRKKHMIISGGENVYPVEVENVLVDHPAVLDAAVLGLPDQRWGEIVTAAVVTATGADLGLDEVDAFCRARLAPYKVPKRVFVLEDFPRTASGKVLKHVLRADLLARATVAAPN